MATKTAPKKPPKAKPAAKPAKSVKEGVKKLSLLTAAAQVLSESSDAMNAQALVEAVVKAKLWNVPNGGKTPTATLSAAILREISLKGKESRFKKVGPGQFLWTGKPVVKEPKAEKPAKATVAPKAVKPAPAVKKSAAKAKPKPKAKKKPAPVAEVPASEPVIVPLDSGDGTFPLSGADEPAIN